MEDRDARLSCAYIMGNPYHRCLVHRLEKYVSLLSLTDARLSCAYIMGNPYHRCLVHRLEKYVSLLSLSQ